MKQDTFLRIFNLRLENDAEELWFCSEHGLRFCCDAIEMATPHSIFLR